MDPPEQSPTSTTAHAHSPPEPPRMNTKTSPAQSASTSNYFTYPMTYAVSGILRRLSSDTHHTKSSTRNSSVDSFQSSAIYNAPRRIASPYQPPPLTPLTLSGWQVTTSEKARILSKALAEEIRLLVPASLQLVDHWQLVYSMDQDGVMLSTLYEKCEDFRGKRGGFILVVRDGAGGVFGAYLSDALRPQAHYYGTGECFLWRASVLKQMLDLSLLPPPPSTDTTNAQRSTTISSPTRMRHGEEKFSGTSTPERIRFKAFPYSGVNDYMIYCQQDYLSVGGGDGHYGLWLDDSLDKGVSSTCLTFGNEPLSDEGAKFEVMGVELWYMGS